MQACALTLAFAQHKKTLPQQTVKIANACERFTRLNSTKPRGQTGLWAIYPVAENKLGALKTSTCRSVGALNPNVGGSTTDRLIRKFRGAIVTTPNK